MVGYFLVRFGVVFSFLYNYVGVLPKIIGRQTSKSKYSGLKNRAKQNILKEIEVG